MLQLTVRLTARPDRSRELVQALRAARREAAGLFGCAAAHLAADLDDANAVWYVEEWPDADEFEAQVRTTRFSHLLSLIETAAFPPLLEVRVVAESRGLDYLERVSGTVGEHASLEEDGKD